MYCIKGGLPAATAARIIIYLGDTIHPAGAKRMVIIYKLRTKSHKTSRKEIYV